MWKGSEASVMVEREETRGRRSLGMEEERMVDETTEAGRMGRRANAECLTEWRARRRARLVEYGR